MSVGKHLDLISSSQAWKEEGEKAGHRTRSLKCTSDHLHEIVSDESQALKIKTAVPALPGLTASSPATSEAGLQLGMDSG